MSRYRTLFGWLVWWSWYLLAIAKGGYDHEGTVFKDNLCICSRFSCSGLALNLGQSQVVSPLRRPWNGYAKVGGGDEGGPCARLGCRALTHGWISKIRSRLWEDETEVETEAVAYVAIARSLIAWAHTIVERTATLVVLVGQQRLDQLGFVQVQVWNDLTPPWVRRQVRCSVAENGLQLSKTVNEKDSLDNKYVIHWNHKKAQKVMNYNTDTLPAIPTRWQK